MADKSKENKTQEEDNTMWAVYYYPENRLKQALIEHHGKRITHDKKYYEVKADLNYEGTGKFVVLVRELTTERQSDNFLPVVGRCFKKLWPFGKKRNARKEQVCQESF